MYLHEFINAGGYKVMLSPLFEKLIKLGYQSRIRLCIFANKTSEWHN